MANHPNRSRKARAEDFAPACPICASGKPTFRIHRVANGPHAGEWWWVVRNIYGAGVRDGHAASDEAAAAAAIAASPTALRDDNHPFAY